MRVSLLPLLCGLILGVPFARAERSRTPRALARCVRLLDDPRPQSKFVESMLARYRDVKVRDLAGFRGYYVVRHGRRPAVTIDLPELKQGSPRQWRIDEWDADGLSHFVYDLGARTLERDFARVNLLLVGLAKDGFDQGAFLRASASRRRDLRDLARFQDTIARRVAESYGRTLANDGDGTPELFTNADLFAAFDRKLSPGARAGDIAGGLVMAARMTYDEHRDFLRPSFSDLAREMGADDRRPLHLPFFTRANVRRVEALWREFNEEYGPGPACELGPLFTFRPRVGEALRLRLLLKVYDRARERQCQTIVTSFGGSSLVESYGFRFWRNASFSDGRRGRIYVLPVNTPQFNGAYARIADRLRELAP